MYCTSCGSAQSDSAAECGLCGTRFDVVEAGPQTQWELPQPAAQDRVSPLLRHGRATIAAAALIVLGGLAVAGWRVHWPSALFGSATAPPTLTWTAGQVPLPINATVSTSQYYTLADVACPTAINCVAVGTYTTGSGSSTRQSGLIETLSGGSWTGATAPSTVQASTGGFAVGLAGVACPSAGDCVAVGASYNASQKLEIPLIETLSGSTWAAASPPLPGDADQGQPAALDRVACPAPGTCIAIGVYTDRNGASQGMIDTLSDRTWTAARAPLPADAFPIPTPTSSVLTTTLDAVRCPAPGTCVASGWYTDRNGGVQGVIETLSGGSWTAAKAPMPRDAAAPDPNGYLFTVGCQAPGSCQAAGRYDSRNGHGRDVIVTLSGGRWTPAAVPLPADAGGQGLGVDQGEGLFAVACQAAGTCEAAGSYIARDGGQQGVIDTLSGGKWTAVRAPLPADAEVAQQAANFESAVCPSPTTCFFVGGYRTADGSTEALIETGAPKSS